MNSLTEWARTHPVPAALAAVLLLALAVRAARKAAGRAPAAVLVASLAAAACTAYSADTSWRFAADYLGMASAGERAAMFAAAELALFACALMARQNLRTQDTPGAPGVLVWVITGVQVIPAYSESGIVGGTVRAVVGPVLAALLWHLAMGIELRHAKPGADSGSLPALLVREARERLLSRLGLAVRERTAEQITRDRWTVKAVALAAKLSEMEPGARGRTRVSRRLSVAVGQAQAGASEEQRTKLLGLLAARRHSASLATIELPSPWEVGGEITVERVAEERPALPTAQRSQVVPAGVRLLPLVARPEQGERDDQEQPPPQAPKVVIPASVPWHWKDGATPSQDPSGIRPKVTTAVPAQAPREVVTEVVALTPSELCRRARRLNREVVTSTTRPVTIDRLREEYGLTRREAAELRRQVVTPKEGNRS
jgi:hypothetical protein